MKTHIKTAVLAAMLVHGVAHSMMGNAPLGRNQVEITNATNMPLVVRAMRREGNAARWHNIKENDPVFDRANIRIAERSSTMMYPFTLQPGQKIRVPWLESWKFDLVFAPQGSDLANRISQTPCTVSKDQAMTNLHQGYWGNVNGGTQIIFFYVASDAAKRQLLRSSAKQSIGESAGQQAVAVGKVNMAVIYEVKKRLTPDQAATQKANLINTIQTETGM